MAKETLAVPFELKAASVEARQIVGYASVFGPPADFSGDVVQRGAFAASLDYWRKSGQPLPLIDSHNYESVRNVVGAMYYGGELPDGLLTGWEIVDSPDGDEVLARVARPKPLVTGLSIGYRPVRTEPASAADQRRGIKRYLHEVELLEVSLVVYPMQPRARLGARLLTPEQAFRPSEVRHRGRLVSRTDEQRAALLLELEHTARQSVLDQLEARASRLDLIGGHHGD